MKRHFLVCLVLFTFFWLSCTLDSTGYGPASSSDGGAGAGGQVNTGGSGGNSGSTTGSSGSSTSGTGGISGSGGDSAGSSGGGAGGEGGTAGSGGDGGGSPIPIKCFGGEKKTPVSYSVSTVSGSSNAKAFMLALDGTSTSSISNPASIDCTTREFPSVLVSSGHNGMNMQLDSTIGYEHRLVDVSSISECQSVGFYSDACDLKVAYDLWCTLYPAEQSSCSIQAVFTPLGILKTYNNNNPGDSKIAAMIRCSP